MPKNSTTDVLRRWRALDERLAGFGLLTPTFAREWKVSERTIRRDLDAFRELDQVIVSEWDGEISEHRWLYGKGVVPLFVSTLVDSSDRIREAIQAR